MYLETQLRLSDTIIHQSIDIKAYFCFYVGSSCQALFYYVCQHIDRFSLQSEKIKTKLVFYRCVSVGRFFGVVCFKRLTSFYPCWHSVVKHLIMYSPNERYLEPVAKTPHLIRRWLFWAPSRSTGAFTNRNIHTTKICLLNFSSPSSLIDLSLLCRGP